MGYGNKEQVNVEESVIYSLEPGIYLGGKFAEVKKDSVGKDGEEKKPVLVFVLETADGKKHQHTEWEQANDTKINNQLARVGSYIRQINPDYEVPDLDSWEQFRDHVVEQMKNSANVPVNFKIVANVYNPTKPITQLPNYKGAVLASSKKASLKFSASEISDNAIYKKILAGEYTAESAMPDYDSPIGESEALPENPEDIL